VENMSCRTGLRSAARGVAVLAALLGVAVGAQAADYPDPSKQIKMVVAFVPGGGTDLIGRMAAKAIQDVTGASVMVDNRAGAGGIIGTTAVARAAPDGYTLITGGTGAHAINPALYKDLPYDPIKDFEPISLVATSPYLMLVPRDFPARSVREFIEYAKARPQQLAMASSGSGGMPHLTGEMFQLMTGTKLIHVPYKGTGAVFIDLIANRVQITFSDIAAAYPYVLSGSLRVLAITSPQRSKTYPDIPTVAESGVPGFDSVGWFGVFSPKGTPAAINRQLSQAIATYVKQPAVLDQMNKLGVEPTASTPEAFGVVLRRDIDRWAKVVKDSGAKVE
jgi:tripartite-type tricarboxylate transporter receptor subunit TctC